MAGSNQLALMFGSASPSLTEGDVLEIAHKSVLEPGGSGKAESTLLRDLVRSAAISRGEEAYAEGYALAEDLLQRLDVDTSRAVPTPVDEIADKLGVERMEVGLSNTSIRAIAVASPKRQPRVLLNTSCPFNEKEPGRRFSLAHELCHILHDRTKARELGVVSGPWAPVGIERRANAFAAMLLMPTEAVKLAISCMPVPEDSAQGVVDLASRFGTSITATLEHIGNLQQWDDATRERVRAEMASAAAMPAVPTARSFPSVAKRKRVGRAKRPRHGGRGRGAR